MSTTISLVRQWLDAAHAQTFLPPEPRGGIAFELPMAADGTNDDALADNDGDELATEANVGLSFLRRRAAHLSRAREELLRAFPAHAPGNWAFARDLWNPYAVTLLHGKLARSVSLLQIALVELFVHRADAAETQEANPQENGKIVVLLPDAAFESALNALTAQLRTEFRFDNDEALAGSFLFFPYSQLGWMGGTGTLPSRVTVVVAPAVDPRAREWQHTLLLRLDESEFFDSHNRRLVLLLPSYTPTEDLADALERFRGSRAIAEQKRRRVFATRSPDEHLRMVLARHQVSETQAKSQFLRAARVDGGMRIVVALTSARTAAHPGPAAGCAETETETETKIDQSPCSSSVSAQPAAGPGCAAVRALIPIGLHVQTPWSELDETHGSAPHMHLATADTLLDELRRALDSGELGDTSRCVVICDSDAGRQTLLARLYHALPAERLHDSVYVRLATDLDAVYAREPDVRFVAVWCGAPQEGLSGGDGRNMDRVLRFLGMLDTRSYAGVQVFSNSRAFCDALVVERERVHAWLDSDAWYGQRTLPRFVGGDGVVDEGDDEARDRELRSFLALTTLAGNGE